MNKITDNENLGYAAYNGQMKQLRMIAMDKLGAEKVALMTEKDVIKFIRDSGYVPMVVNYDDGGCDIETIYLVKEELLESEDVLKLCR